MLTLTQTIITSHFLHHCKLDLIYIKAESGNCALLEPWVHVLSTNKFDLRSALGLSFIMWPINNRDYQNMNRPFITMVEISNLSKSMKFFSMVSNYFVYAGFCLKLTLIQLSLPQKKHGIFWTKFVGQNLIVSVIVIRYY